MQSIFNEKNCSRERGRAKSQAIGGWVFHVQFYKGRRADCFKESTHAYFSDRHLDEEQVSFPQPPRLHLPDACQPWMTGNAVGAPLDRMGTVRMLSSSPPSCSRRAMHKGPARSPVNGTATGKKSQGAGQGSLVRTKENSLTCLLCVLRDDPQDCTNSMKTRSGTGCKGSGPKGHR